MDDFSSALDLPDSGWYIPGMDSWMDWAILALLLSLFAWGFYEDWRSSQQDKK